MDVIVSHVNADFDSLGGLVGAARLYPGAAMVLPGGAQTAVQSFLALHCGVLDVRTAAEVDPQTITRVVVVDTSSARRLGKAAEWLELPEVEVHLYDHHPGAAQFPAVFRRCERWGAVSSILAHELRERGEVLTPIEATTLLLGIYEDTGSLQYAGTTPDDLEAAAWLLRSGGELDVVAEFTRHSLTPSQRALLQELVEGAETHEVRGMPVVLACASSGSYVDEAAALVHRLLEAEDVAAAIAMLTMEGSTYVIGRARTDAIDLGAALGELGGGGHPRAASATLREPCDPAELKQRLLDLLQRHLTPEPTAGEIMSRPVRAVPPDATVAEARRRMIKYGHSGLLVMEDGKLLGVVTRRDVDKARHHRLEHASVRGYMTRDPHTVDPRTALSELEQIMITEGIGRLPVVRRGEVMGLVTRTDVLRALHGERYLVGSPANGPEPVVRMLRESLPAPVQRILEEIGRLAEREEYEAFVVGGFVRDLLLNVRNLDVDILVEPDGIALARAVAAETGGTLEVKGERFGTASITSPEGQVVDFATARSESYARPGALPDVEPSSVLDDLRRRDFTINAMAIALRPEQFGELLDPFGGRRDVERRRIRALHPLSFVEDPTRLFRAVRFEDRYHFRMDSHTETLARSAIADGALGSITPERVREQFYLVFRERKPLGALLRLQELGILEWLHLGLVLNESLFQALPKAIEWWKKHGRSALRQSLLHLAALLAPLGAASALATAEQKLHIPPPQLRILEGCLTAAAGPCNLVPEHAAPAEVVDRLRPLPPETLVLLYAALPRDAKPQRELLHRFVTEWRHTKLEITGDDLKQLGYLPGPAMGTALAQVLRAKLNGELRHRDAELACVRRLLEAAAPHAHKGRRPQG